MKCCLKCKTTERLTKHHIVPQAYLLAYNEKEEEKHLAILCRKCHDEYELKFVIYQDKIKKDCHIEFDYDCQKISTIKGIAKKLLNNPYTKNSDKEWIKRYLGRDFTMTDLIEISRMNTPSLPKYISKKIKYYKFVKMCHNHFREFIGYSKIPSITNTTNTINKMIMSRNGNN